MENKTQNDHAGRINKVFEYIDENLNKDLSLKIISEIACFSPFHFHRIFKILTKETLNTYVNRLRIEKSVTDLLYKSSTISEIAFKYGYSDKASYSKSFKKFYGVNPTDFKRQNTSRYAPIKYPKKKDNKAYPTYEKYLSNIDTLLDWLENNAKIEVKKMPKMNLAYISSLGKQHPSSTFNKLIKWVLSKGILNKKESLLTIYHENLKITEANKIRIQRCLLLEEPLKGEGQIGTTSIEEGKCVIGSLEISLDEFEKSWAALFIWLDKNGFKRAERSPFEIYHNKPTEHPENKSIVDICIPIE
ncbi:AraC family transcriptional regulator [Aquimarina rhabdastrellae]